MSLRVPLVPRSDGALTLLIERPREIYVMFIGKRLLCLNEYEQCESRIIVDFVVASLSGIT